MGNFDPDPPDSLRPNWEDRLTSDLRRVCPDWTGAQRRTTIRILSAWGRWLSPRGPDAFTLAAEVVFLPRWWIERCPFMSAERLRRCLRFFEGLWTARKLGFTEAVHALHDLRRELDALRHGHPPPALRSHACWRAAA
jgi:hypothetical protein